ncbi:MAG: M1 family metallopeptidase [candidate division Zixibacteria bacterium]
MKIIKIFIVSFAILIISSGAVAQPAIFENPLSPRIANYAIDVRLDTEEKRLYGNETLVWHNRSDDRIDELQFHLYLNAFRNNRSTLFEESGGELRGMGLDDDGWGFIEVTKIALADGIDLTDQMEFIQPDDDYINDKTVCRLPLARAILPGDSIIVNIDFFAKLPSPPIRTGHKEEFYFVGQWFPKIGVYTDDGWNTHQFHALTEFFADFGVYDIKITVPDDNIVGATGLEVNVIDNGDGTATHYYHAEDVHDFAWTASPEFVVFTDRSQDVDIRILMQPDRLNQVDRYMQATKASIEYLQDWIGDYPYPNLTVVDPRRGAFNAGGMEYPTLITSIGMYAMPDGIRFTESVIAHEFAHNYFYHLLASNEFEDEWLDEGFTSYAEGKMMEGIYGSDGNAADLFGIKFNISQISRFQYFAVPDLDSIAGRAYKYYSEGSEASISFSKASLMLQTLENYVGEETMNRILRTYFERWKFKHPKTRDFIDLANEISGQDLNWYFDQAIYGTSKLDYRVRYLFTRKVREDKGYDFTFDPYEKPSETDGDDDGEKVAENNDDIKEDTSSDSTVDETTETLYYSGVNLQRMGGFIFPVELEVVFEDGETIRETWDGKGKWKKFRYTRSSKLFSARIDPDNKVRLDVNYTNNSMSVEPQGYGIAKLSAKLLFWFQFMLEQPDLLTILPSLAPSPE